MTTATLEPIATDQEDHVDLDARQMVLESRVLLLCPTVGWWRGQYQLPGRSTETVSAGETVDREDVTTPRAKLMTHAYPLDQAGVPWKKRFQKIESRLKALKDMYSVAFPIPGVRVVPKTKGPEFMDTMYGLTIGRLRKQYQRAVMEDRTGDAAGLAARLSDALEFNGANAHPNTPIYQYTANGQQSIAYELHSAATEFCNDWSTIRDQIAQHNDVFKLVAAKVPVNASLMRSKFYLDVVPVELAGGHATGQVLDQDDLAEHNDVVREACRRRVDEAIEAMIAGPRQQLAEALAGLQGLVERNGRVTAKSFSPIRDAIAKIRMFDFVANADLLQQIQQLEQRLDITTPGSLDALTAANNGFSAAIAGFMDEVQDAEGAARDMQTFGRRPRALML